MNCATTNKEARDLQLKVCKRRNELRDYKQQEARDLQVCKRRNELRDYKQNKCVRGAMNCATTNKTSV